MPKDRKHAACLIRKWAGEVARKLLFAHAQQSGDSLGLRHERFVKQLEENETKSEDVDLVWVTTTVTLQPHTHTTMMSFQNWHITCTTMCTWTWYYTDLFWAHVKLGSDLVGVVSRFRVCLSALTTFIHGCVLQRCDETEVTHLHYSVHREENVGGLKEEMEV